MWDRGEDGMDWRMMKSWVSCYDGLMSSANGLERACACGFERERWRDRERNQTICKCHAMQCKTRMPWRYLQSIPR